MKKKFFTFAGLLLSSLFVLGCSQQKTGDNIVRKFSETFNSHDATAVANLYTEDAVYMLAGEPAPLRGRKAIEENYAAFFTGFPDIEVDYMETFLAKDGIDVKTLSEPDAVAEERPRAGAARPRTRAKRCRACGRGGEWPVSSGAGTEYLFVTRAETLRIELEILGSPDFDLVAPE